MSVNARSMARLFRNFVRPKLERLEVRCVPTTVTNGNDSGEGSLRQALVDTPAGGIIDFAPELSGGFIRLTSGELVVEKSVTINGPPLSGGIPQIDIRRFGPRQFRIFHIPQQMIEEPNVIFRKLTISNGLLPSSESEGAGIRNLGFLTLIECDIRDHRSKTFNTRGVGIFNGGINGGSLTINNSFVRFNQGESDGTFQFQALGGGIYNEEESILTINHSSISDNVFTNTFGGNVFFAGGGIFNAGGLTLSASLVARNSVGLLGFGGGIESVVGAGVEMDYSTITLNTGGGMAASGATITNSTFSYNEGNSEGGYGGLFLNNGDVTNSTFSGNSAVSGGGGITTGTTVNLRNCTIANNSAEEGGGGIATSAIGLVRLYNTIVGNNTAGTGGPNVFGAFASGGPGVSGYNVFGDITGGSGYEPPEDKINQTAMMLKLLPLGDYGGIVGFTYYPETIALAPLSVAVNSGLNAHVPVEITTDERKGTFNRFNGTVDVGAFEVQASRSPNRRLVRTPMAITLSEKGLVLSQQGDRGQMNLVRGVMISAFDEFATSKTQPSGTSHRFKVSFSVPPSLDVHPGFPIGMSTDFDAPLK